MSDRFTHAEMAAEIGKLVWSKETWLKTHGSEPHPRPAYEVEIRKRELAVLQQAHADYERAASRPQKESRA